MDIRSLMNDYLNECDVRAKSKASINVHGLIRESTLPLQVVSNVWEVADDPERLCRKFSFDSLDKRALFIEHLTEIEQKTQHFAKITIEGYDVTIEVWTHDVNRVTELDKEYASDCDSVYDDVTLIGFTDYE